MKVQKRTRRQFRCLVFSILISLFLGLIGIAAFLLWYNRTEIFGSGQESQTARQGVFETNSDTITVTPDWQRYHPLSVAVFYWWTNSTKQIGNQVFRSNTLSSFTTSKHDSPRSVAIVFLGYHGARVTTHDARTYLLWNRFDLFRSYCERSVVL